MGEDFRWCHTKDQDRPANSGCGDTRLREGIEGISENAVGGTCLFSVSFMIVVPREEKTMKDIRNIGLKEKNKSDPCHIHYFSRNSLLISTEQKKKIMYRKLKYNLKKPLPYELLS